MSDVFAPAGRHVLVGDQRNDQLLLFRDLDSDGAALAASEVSVFFDANNAAGLAAPTQNVTGVFQARDASVFVADADADAVYRLMDLNGDLDAQDPWEATVWFGPENASELIVKTPNAVHQDETGAIFISYAGLSQVYRTIDLNHDGDAMDPGEAVPWFDFTTLDLDGIPFSLSFSDKVGFLTNIGDPSSGALYRLEDQNNDGRIQPGEAVQYLTPGSESTPLDNIVATIVDHNSVICMTWYPAKGNEIVLHRLQDQDGSGVIDAVGEVQEVWSSKLAPNGALTEIGFSLASDDRGQLLMAGNAFSGAATVLVLSDEDGNSNYLAPLETTVFAASNDDASLRWARAVEFYDPQDPIVAMREDAGAAMGTETVVLGSVIALALMANRSAYPKGLNWRP